MNNTKGNLSLDFLSWTVSLQLLPHGLFSMPLHKHVCLLSLITFASTSDALWVVWGSILLPKVAFKNTTFKTLEVTRGQKNTVDYRNSEKVLLDPLLLTLMGQLMLVSAPWLILDADWKTSRGPFSLNYAMIPWFCDLLCVFPRAESLETAL